MLIHPTIVSLESVLPGLHVDPGTLVLIAIAFTGVLLLLWLAARAVWLFARGVATILIAVVCLSLVLSKPTRLGDRQALHAAALESARDLFD